jgi:hypothetical protein
LAARCADDATSAGFSLRVVRIFPPRDFGLPVGSANPAPLRRCRKLRQSTIMNYNSLTIGKLGKRPTRYATYMQYNSRSGNAAPAAPNVVVINLPAAFRRYC